MTRIAIFASGRGSNARNIINYLKNHPSISVSIIVSNKQTAPVLDIGKQFDINTLVINRVDFYNSTELLDVFQKQKIDFIVLAGFLWLIPSYVVKAYSNRIVNIHPALLPKYGGKGMYGMNVHKAVHAAKERETGITIHYVNEKYDEGNIIFQASCQLETTDTPESIAQKIHQLEHAHFPRIIEATIDSING
ncbi:MAG: phosphoribosylglycinamide formyltransferase [Saprospiraceae bacterium]